MSNSRSPRTISCAAQPRRSPAAAGLNPPVRFFIFNRQRPARRRPLLQSCSSLLPTHVAKKTDVESIVTTHRRLPLIAPAAVNHSSETFGNRKIFPPGFLTRRAKSVDHPNQTHDRRSPKRGGKGG